MASCQFGSPHQKEFRFLRYGLDVSALDVRCPGGHQHVVIQGKYTKASAAYVLGLARHLACEFRRALLRLDRTDGELHVSGLESVVGNDVLASSVWTLEAFCPCKRPSHINLLETKMALKFLMICAKRSPDSRVCDFLDSQVAKGALSKGRSASRALQPLCRKAAAIQIVACLYPAWNFAPTRLNVADDPTRSTAIRSPSKHSIIFRPDVDLAQLHATALRRPFANWVRMLLLISLPPVSDSCAAEPEGPAGHAWTLFCFDCPTSMFCLDCLNWTRLISAVVAGADACLVPLIRVGVLVPVASLIFLAVGRLSCKYRTWLLAYLIADPFVVGAMEPQSTAERKRAALRSSTVLVVASRTVRPETRQGRQKLLEKFSVWLQTLGCLV